MPFPADFVNMLVKYVDSGFLTKKLQHNNECFATSLYLFTIVWSNIQMSYTVAIAP